MSTQANRFTLLNTSTEAEATLRADLLALRSRVYSLECMVAGLVELLHEHGIEADDPEAPEAMVGP